MNKFTAYMFIVITALLIMIGAGVVGREDERAEESIRISESSTVELTLGDLGLHQPKIESLKILSDLYRCPVADLIG